MSLGKHARKTAAALMALILAVLVWTSADAAGYQKLQRGSKGAAVFELQQALLAQGDYSGVLDGKFGAGTESAVKHFQQRNGLKVDGIAGTQTQTLLFSKGKTSQSAAASAAANPVSPAAGSSASLREGSRGSEVSSLQKRLKELGFYSGKIDGIYGKGTAAAVKKFQSKNKLTADGVAGKKTLAALNGSSSAASSKPASVGPAAGEVQLLHWYNQVKPSLKTGQNLLVYDPASGISWTLRVLSRGRHCDAEPLTLADTQRMTAAFGNQNTWTQKAVYVKLPDGRWSVASTHDMPHLTGKIKDNGFDGHLCVHFLRDMDEAEKNDPKYGVANQQTIRAKWRALTGETVN